MLCHQTHLLASPPPPGRSHRPWRRAFWALNVLAPSATVKLAPTEPCSRRRCTYSSESTAWPWKALFRSVNCSGGPREAIPEGTRWRLGQNEATNVVDSWDGVERWSDEWAKDGRGSDGLNNARGVTVERESKKPLCPSQRRRCEGGEEGREELSPAQYDRQTGGIVRVDLPPPAPSS